MATAPDELEASAPDVTVRLRPSAEDPILTVFEELCHERGLKTRTAIARYMRVSPRQIKRILARDNDPSEKFIAKALVLWPRCSFRALFAVVDEKTGQEMR